MEESVWTLVENGARSLDEIAERLNISVTAAARIVGSSGEDLQEWYEKHHPLCKICGKRDFCTEDCSCDRCERGRTERIKEDLRMKKIDEDWQEYRKNRKKEYGY